MSERWYRCKRCFLILYEKDLEDGCCPVCGEIPEVPCEKDVPFCPHDIVESIAFCPVCGEGVCPKCGCHDVEQLTRITGYIQSVDGFNEGKRQEVKDRNRYDIA